MRMLRAIAVASLFLLPVAVLSQTSDAVTGTALYRERIALPANAVFEATLEDVSRADAPSQVVGSVRLEHPGNPPFHFSISFTPGSIVDSHTYAVRARITVEGRLMFTSTERVQVLTQGHGSEIGAPILMRMTHSTPASQQTAPDTTLTETYWKLVAINGKAVTTAEHEREASLIFHGGNGRLTGSGGCNRLTGGYTVEGGLMHLSGVASTMMACMNGMETEQAFVAALHQVERWKITGKTLWLYGKDKSPLAQFEAVALR